MINLLYKEFKLNIHYIFYLILPVLFGALFFIPQWFYTLVFMYFCFVSVPNICGRSNAQNDIGFTVIMPVRKRDVVKSKILSFVVIELIHIFFGAIFAFVNLRLYNKSNFCMDVNLALFGVAFIMYGVFNLCFFPVYFKTAYFYGKALIIGLFASLGIAAITELSSLLFPRVEPFLEGGEFSGKLFRLGFLFVSVLIFVLLNFIAVNLSVKRFEKADL